MASTLIGPRSGQRYVYQNRQFPVPAGLFVSDGGLTPSSRASASISCLWVGARRPFRRRDPSAACRIKVWLLVLVQKPLSLGF